MFSESTSPTSATMATPSDQARPEDCLACKLIGAGAFSGLGIYALNLAKLEGAFARVRPAGKSLVASRIQAVIGAGECWIVLVLIFSATTQLFRGTRTGFLLAGIGRLAM
jgi:hypothetical protein